MFEPVHPVHVSAFGALRLNEYRRPESDDRALHAIFTSIFSGAFHHPRVDRSNRRLVYDGLIIKDVFASLLAAWACRRFPDVRPVLLVRHPFDVALSKLARKHWIWMTNPHDLLSDADLVEDHLTAQEDLLAAVGREDHFFCNQVAIWAAIHSVLFRQFDADSITVLFYEDVLRSPGSAMAAFWARLGENPAGHRLDPERLAKPSWVSTRDGIAAARRAAGADWPAKLARDERDRGYAILEAFGLQNLYDAHGQPQRTALGAFPIGNPASGRLQA